MSSEEPIRSVPDELFRKVPTKAERHLPDALFGGPPPVPQESGRPSEGASSGAAGESDRADSLSTEQSDGAGVEDDAAVAAPGVGSAADAAAAAVVESPIRIEGGDIAGGDVAESADVADDSAEPAVESVAAMAGGRPVVAEAGAGAVAAGVDDERAVGSVVAMPGDEPVGEPVAGRMSDESAVEPMAAVTGDGPAVTGGSAESATANDSPVELAAAATGPAGTMDEETSSPAVAGAEPERTDIPDLAAGAAVDADNAAPVAEVAADADAGESESASAGSGTPDESSKPQRPVLLVIADSLSYFGPKGGLPADHPRIWPNLVADELDWDVELVARIGWTCRDAYWALIGDPRIWAAVPRAGAVVFAVGGMDTLPSPLPTALRELIRYVRPPAMRRTVRATYNWLQPKLSKLGRPVALPPKVSVDYLEQSRTALAQLRPDLPVVAVLPSVHNCEAYGRVHSGRERAVKALRAWSGRTSVPLVDLGEAVRDNVFSGEANPDGIHWGWAGHTAVANAMVKTLQEVR